MSFYDPLNLQVGKAYNLIEVLYDKKTCLGAHFLVSVEPHKRNQYPVLGFSKTPDSEPEIFLTEAHAQFGDPTWRRSFRDAKGWQVSWPDGLLTWNHASVRIENVE